MPIGTCASRPFDVVDGPSKQVAASPHTKSTTIGSPSIVAGSVSQVPGGGEEERRRSSSGMFDSMTPTWRRWVK